MLHQLAALAERTDALLYAEIAARRAELNPDRRDVLSLLLQASDAEGQALSDLDLRDELMTLLVAGHETTATALTDITRCLACISVRRMDVENQTVNGDDPAYAANQGVEMLQRGRIAVQRDTSESPVPGDAFYLGTSGSEAGRLYKTASSTRVYIPAAFLSWERSERAADSDGVILVRLKAVA